MIVHIDTYGMSDLDIKYLDIYLEQHDGNASNKWIYFMYFSDLIDFCNMFEFYFVYDYNTKTADACKDWSLLL